MTILGLFKHQLLLYLLDTRFNWIPGFRLSSETCDWLGRYTHASHSGHDSHPSLGGRRGKRLPLRLTLYPATGSIQALDNHVPHGYLHYLTHLPYTQLQNRILKSRH
jgi:hypothetical protein